MNFQQCCQYLQQKPDAQLDFPFDPDVYVYKIHGKMFALISPSGNQSSSQAPQINLKCEPSQAQALRDVFPAILPGYHMNKRHWNTLILDGSIPTGEIERLIDHSYSLVVKGLSKTLRHPLELKYGVEALYGE